MPIVASVPLKWVAALDAVAATDYLIKADKTASGAFNDTVATRDATERAPSSGIYTPFETTLAQALTPQDTTVVLSSGADFAANDIVLVEKELIRLGSEATAYSNSKRGLAGSIPQSHAQNAKVYLAHESYSDTNVDFGTRKVIRYRIFRVQGSDQAVAAELMAIYPTAPPTHNLCTVYGILNDLQGNPKQGVNVVMEINDDDNYLAETGELLFKETEPVSTDPDGYFEFFAPRALGRVGGGSVTIKVGEQVTPKTIVVPDLNFINYLAAPAP